MSMPSQTSNQPSFFNLHVEGVGYLNRVRTIKPKKGQEFLACHVAALRGADSDVSYTRFDCRVSGADAQEVVRRLESAVAAEKSVIIGFRIGDIYPEMFTFEKGDLSGFGLVNAVTHYSQDVDDYDRATDFEALGGKLIELAPTEWKGLAHAA